MENVLTGFNLIKEYPGSPKLGTFEPYITGEYLKQRPIHFYLKNPEYWQPVFGKLAQLIRDYYGSYEKENVGGGSTGPGIIRGPKEYGWPLFWEIPVTNPPLLSSKIFPRGTGKTCPQPTPWECISFLRMNVDGVDRFCTSKHKLPKGFYLIKEYPGSPKLGTFEPYTTGLYLKHPEYWLPAYEKQNAPNKQPTGFYLIKEYPGTSKKLGDFEPYTTGEFLNSEYWAPAYWSDKMDCVYAGLREFIHEESNKLSESIFSKNLLQEAQKLLAEKKKLEGAENAATEEKGQSPVEKKTTRQKIEEINHLHKTDAVAYNKLEILNEISIVQIGDKVTIKSADKSVLVERCWKGSFSIVIGPLMIKWVDYLHEGVKLEDAFDLAIKDFLPVVETNPVRYPKYLVTVEKEVAKDEEKKLAELKELSETEPEIKSVATTTITRTKFADGNTSLEIVCDDFNPIELLGLLELTQLEIQKKIQCETKSDVIER